MNQTLFRDLKREIKRDYGLTKKSIRFIPFEDWRKKIEGYDTQFPEEYQRNLIFLRNKMNLSQLKRINNPNKKLILFVGIPGAGKTTLSEIIQKEIQNTILLRGHDLVDLLGLYGKNLKKYRQILRTGGFEYPDPWYISYFYQEQLTRECLNLGYNVVFDDHIRTRANRMGYYHLARACGAEIIFVQIEAPFETYVKREDGEINGKKLKFLGNMVLQTEDINVEEKRKYDGIISVDGMADIRKIRKGDNYSGNKKYKKRKFYKKCSCQILVF